MSAMTSRLRSLLDLARLVGQLDLSRLGELAGAVAEVRAARTWRERIEATIRLARLLAEMTPTAADDELIELLDAALHEPILDALARLVAAARRRGWLQVLSQSPDLHEAEAQGAAIGLSSGRVVALARSLHELYEATSTSRGV